ncbi:MAG: hypothetical protein WA364_08680 [Candidatus Nitrosopolaris sp.]
MEIKMELQFEEMEAEDLLGNKDIDSFTLTRTVWTAIRYNH